MSKTKLIRRIAKLTVIAHLVTFGLVPAAQAEIVGTETLMQQNDRQQQIERVQGFMSKQQVEDQMVALGVDIEQAKQRVASLTDAELQMLGNQLDTLPAGGDALAVLGILLLVFLVLELLGITNVFTAI